MMEKLWQLKKLSTGEPLNDPQKLPENWGPVFGMSGISDRLGDLSWLGDAFSDQGWFVVGEVPPPVSEQEQVLATVEKLLRDTAWAVAVDNTSMTKGERIAWLEFREALRAVPQQSGFPHDVQWPAEPQ